MLKKAYFVLFFLFFLSSCLGDSDSTVSEGLIKKEMSSFSIDIPANWDVIEDLDSILPKITNGNIELAVHSSNVVNGFSNNLLILSDNLSSFVSSKDFSILNNVGASDEYLNYKKLDSRDILFQDGDSSLIYVFEAKYNLDTPKLKFLQTARVCNQNKGFLLTISIPTSTVDISKYEHLFTTFSCK